MRHLASPPLETRLASFSRASSLMYSVVMETDCGSMGASLGLWVSLGGYRLFCGFFRRRWNGGDRVAFAGRELTVQ